MEIFSQRLRRLRMELNLKQEELGEKLNVSKYSISTYENGREPSFDVLAKAAELFSVSTDYLLGLSDIRKPFTELETDNAMNALLAASETCNAAITQKDVRSTFYKLRSYSQQPTMGIEPAALFIKTLKLAPEMIDAAAAEDAIALFASCNEVTRTVIDATQAIVKAALMKQD